MRVKARDLNVLSLLAIAIILSACLIVPGTSLADDFRVAVIPSSNSIIYSRTIENLKDVTNRNSKNKIIITRYSLDELDAIRSPGADDIDLLIPVGQVALEKIVTQDTNTPILASLVSIQGFNEALMRNNSQIKSANIGAVYLDQPLRRYLEFTRLALPNHKRLGFLVSKEYWKTLSVFEPTIKDFTYNLVIHEENTNLISSLNQVMENADVIVALPDANIFNRRNTHNILLSTYRKLIPLIGFSKSYIKAGALTGIYSTPELIGIQTGELINELANSNPIGTIPRQHASYFQISVNNKVSRSLDVPQLDEDVLIKKMMNSKKFSND